MSDYLVIEESDDQAYQDYLDESFYEFLYKMKRVCMPPRAYTLPNDLNDIKIFWEVG